MEGCYSVLFSMPQLFYRSLPPTKAVAFIVFGKHLIRIKDFLVSVLVIVTKQQIEKSGCRFKSLG